MSHARALLLLCLSSCFAPEQPPITGRVTQAPFKAQLIDETYQLFVRLPPEYDSEPERRFPLIVQLDANIPTLAEFAVTAGFASQLQARGEVPPAVVVGLGYSTAEAAQVHRFRDLGLPIENAQFKEQWGKFVPDGEAPTFYRFLAEELLPYLEGAYRLSGPRGRALFGHSLGGLFVIYALSRHDDAAPLFTGYVAASPSVFWDEGAIYPRWAQFRDPAQPLALFTAAGQLEGPEMMVYFDDFTSRVRAAGFSQLTFESRAYQTDHPGSVAPSFRDGLRFLFAHGLGETP